MKTIEPEPGLPDLVFTANAAIISTARRCLPAFSSEAAARTAGADRGLSPLAGARAYDDIVEMPEGVALEGAGNYIWDQQHGFYGWAAVTIGSRRQQSDQAEVWCGFFRLPSPIRTLSPRYSFLACRTAIFCIFPARLRRRRSKLSTTMCRRRGASPGSRRRVTIRQRRRAWANSGDINCGVALRRTLEDHPTRFQDPAARFPRSRRSACCLRFASITGPEQQKLRSPLRRGRRPLIRH